MNCVPPSQILPFGHLTSGRPLICGTRRHCQQPWKAARPSASPLSQQHSAPGNVERAEGSRDEPNNNRFMIDYQSTRRIWSTWHRLDDDSFAVLASLSAVQHSNTKGSAGPHDDPMPCSGGKQERLQLAGGQWSSKTLHFGCDHCRPNALSYSFLWKHTRTAGDPTGPGELCGVPAGRPSTHAPARRRRFLRSGFLVRRGSITGCRLR